MNRLIDPLRRSASSSGRPDPDNSGRGENGQGAGPGTGGGGGGGGAKPSRGLFGVVMLLTAAILLYLVMTSVFDRSSDVTWQSFVSMIKDDRIKPHSIVIHDRAITAVRKKDPSGGEQTVRFTISGKADVYREELIKLTGGDFKEQTTSLWTQILLPMVPFLLLLAIIWLFIVRGLRNAAMGSGGMLGNFGKSRHRLLAKEMTGITFNDVAGIDEAKDEVEEIIEFLKNPKRFMRLGGRIPRGVLLIGSPGCGKTLLAKAIAGEADVPFFSISGSDFVEMFVGVGASRVRDLFKQAKESAPCIVFLDEIDAVGRRRGGGFTTGGHDEREQTLNAILVEMDGFNSADGVIVVAATNRADVLDPALTRPGRFDRQITVPLPDVKGRLEILKVHAKKIKMGPNVDLERVARATPTFSGADLAAIINEAAIAATLHNKDFVEHEDLEEARDKIRWGRARKSRIREKDENRLTAFHEAGHAVLQALQKDGDPLHKVTIIPRGDAGGATFSLPQKDRFGFSLKWLLATMRTTCGGRIAEEKAMSDVSSGAAMDIMQVTDLAKRMVLDWGMSPRLGFVRYASTDTREIFLPEKDYSDHTAQIIDEEVRRIVDEAYADAKVMLEQNWEKVVAVADALLKYETISGDDVNRLLRGETLGKPTISELLAAESRKAEAKLNSAQPPATELPPGALPRPA